MRVRKVALVGNSVVVSSLASTLKARPDLEVLQLGTASPESLFKLREARPEAVILTELPATTCPDFIFAILQQSPDLLVIGADIDGQRMVVMSGRRASLRTAEDLLAAIGLPPVLPAA